MRFKGFLVAIAALGFIGTDAEASSRSGCSASDTTASFWRGSDARRAVPLAELRAISSGAQTDASQLPCRLATLRSRYASRAGRQQALTDTGAFVTGSAGIVAAFADGAGAATQGYWAAGALLPVLIASFNANEPTRDLFHGAGQGLDFMTARYGEIRLTTRQLLRTMTRADSITDWPNATWTNGLPNPAPDVACASLNARMGHIESQGAEIAKTEARRVLAACSSAAVARSALVVFAQAAAGAQEQYSVLEASDALKLEAAIAQRDHDLRYSPIETFAALAAAPFEAAGALLSGENGREALEALKTQAAFRGLSIDLAEIDLPATPARLNDVVVTDASIAHREIRDAANMLNQAAPHYNRAIGLAERLGRAAKARRLSLGYDATTRAISVGLGIPTQPVATTT